HCLSVDVSGNIYVVGITFSPDFPTFAAFDPSKPGYDSGFLTMISPASAAVIYLPDTSLSFGSQPVNSTSRPSAVNLPNVGSATLNASLAVRGDFAESGNCASVPGGGACTMNGTFNPT